MKILEVNYTDLLGRIFNGYDLHLSLRELGQEAYQVVLNKYSVTESVIPLKNDVILHEQLLHIEKKYSMSNLLMPYGRQLMEEPFFLEAEIVHYHILHSWMISLLDYPVLMNGKNSVWTIHDPWIVTGNCIHPMECGKWRNGCFDCANLDVAWYEMHDNNPNKMWKIKKEIFARINPQIVVSSQFMKKYIEESPLTSSWDRIEVIPFGVKEEMFESFSVLKIRERYNIEPKSFVIGYRADKSKLKGCEYIYSVLRGLPDFLDIHIVTVGEQNLPFDLKSKFRCDEWGWVDDNNIMRDFFRICDVFLMPSLAESFGMMAIEAMAEEAVVIYFQSTVLEELFQESEGGIGVEYLSDKALREVVLHLYENRYECTERGRRGKEFVKIKYTYERYVRKHIELYNKVVLDGE